MSQYDYDYAEDESGHLYEVFDVRDGKRVAWAESQDEAERKVGALTSALAAVRVEDER